MNIVILVSSLSIGGAEKQAVNDANMLIAEHKVHLMVFQNGILKNKLLPEVGYIQIERKGYLKTAKAIANYISQNKIDLVHAFLFAPMIIGALASLITGIPIIWNFHSHEYDIPLKSSLTIKWLSRLNSVKKITFVNNELKDFFENWLCIPKSKSEVLYNATSFKPRMDKKINDKIIIGYTGRIIPQKRVDYLVDLASWLVSCGFNDFTFHIIGDGESRRTVEDRVNEAKLNDRFVFFGFKTDLDEYYDNFDIFINPSKEECLSIALIEAGMKGIPSIAFNIGGNDEIIMDNKTGFIVKTKEELYERTKQLMENPMLRKRFSSAASIHCMNNFTEEKRIEKLNKIFESVVS